MPFGDGTGPAGKGPKTGRGLGYCAGYKSPGYTRGRRAGRRGAGRRIRGGIPMVNCGRGR